ncbi:MAG: type I restriction enzyme HsdR N-terminal domain-containing protein [Desulfobacterales bacterium]
MIRIAMETLIDFVTGKTIPNTGAEANRQAVERYLVENSGYLKTDIRVDHAIAIDVAGERYRSKIDLLVCPGEDARGMMLIKCAAGSLGSWEREALAAARIAEAYPIPYTVTSDGSTAIVLDTLSGRRLGTGLQAIPAREALLREMTNLPLTPYPENRKEREKLIFRSYDLMTVHGREE